MQPPFAFTQDQICRGNLFPSVASTEMGNGKPEAHLPSRGGQMNALGLPVEGVGLLIVAHWAAPTLRAVYRLENRLWLALLECLHYFPGKRCFMLLLPGKCTFQGFRRFDAGLDKQITHQPWICRLYLIVRAVVQSHAVLFDVIPTHKHRPD
ncbi:MAG TPA: hypothetical protein VGD98_12695 [Ktedonobacteraceae bacterium]